MMSALLGSFFSDIRGQTRLQVNVGANISLFKDKNRTFHNNLFPRFGREIEACFTLLFFFYFWDFLTLMKLTEMKLRCTNGRAPNSSRSDVSATSAQTSHCSIFKLMSGCFLFYKFTSASKLCPHVEFLRWQLIGRHFGEFKIHKVRF